jgi:hypothetical protein
MAQMCYANEIEKFNELHEEFKRKFANYSVFVDYFELNWMNCVEMWAQCYRDKQFNLGETTNRIESLNCHLKELGRYSDTLFECYKSVMSSFEHFELQKSIKKFREKFTIPLFKRSDIPEVIVYESLINETVTQNIADVIVDQMNLSFNLEIDFEKIDENIYKIASEGHRTTKTTLVSCKCFRYVNKKLPCFHIFALRKFLSVPLFEKSMISKLFDKQNYLRTSILDSPIARLNFKEAQTKYSLISSVKFLDAKIETDKLANVISRSGQSKFKTQISVVRDLTSAFSEKKSVEIVSRSKSPSISSSEDSSSDTIITQEIPSVSEESVAEINIKPQYREKFLGRPATLTAIGKSRARPKPSLRIRKNKSLE